MKTKRDGRTHPAIDRATVDFMNDLLFAVRMIRRNPGFTATAALTLALGIGATTAIFTIVNAVLLQPLRYHEPGRLVRVSGGATVARYEATRLAESFTEVGAFWVVADNLALAGVDAPEALRGARVSTNFLSILGIAPLLGRGFIPEEETPGPATAIISQALWQRRFGADPQIVGGTVRLDGASCTIVGVLPTGFTFPFPELDVWRPFQPAAIPLQPRTHSPMLSIFARLKPGVSLEQATAEMAQINREYVRTHPGFLDAKANRPESVALFQDDLVKNVRSILWMLFGATGFVLVIACANVASLLLARATSRSREFAVRSALGASRTRLAGQLLIESLLLALVGGGLGVLVADLGLRGLASIPGIDLPRIQEVRLDGTVLAFAVALSAATSLMFGLAPSLRASRSDIAHRIKRSSHLPGTLVTGQIALAIVLLIGAVLMIESLLRLRRIDPGFRAGNLLTMRITLPESRIGELVERVESLPGVRGAAVTLTLPMTGFAATPVQAAGAQLLKLNERPFAILQNVTPGYFRTMGIALQRGRDFARRDSASSGAVAIVNEALARRLWTDGEEPIGSLILVGANPKPLQVVGVVANVRQAGLSEQAGPGIYRPRSQTPGMSAMFAVRTEGDPLRYVNAIRAEVAAIDPDRTITALKTMEEIVDASEGRRHSIMILLMIFASAGLSLAVIGIYGVVAYSVAQRSREMAIRRALGAPTVSILKLVLQQGLMLAIAGVFIGLVGAWALSRVLEALLYEISATDPIIFSGVALLVVFVALAASYVPARRATQLEPITVLRRENT
jgi:predicted permease